MPAPKSARLRFRAFAESDTKALVGLLNDEDVVRVTANIPFPYSESDARAFIAAAHDGPERGFAIELKSGNALIGAIGLRPTDDEGGAPEGAEIGYWIGKAVWNRGYGAEAVQAVTDFAFETLGLARLWASVVFGNPASRRLLEKAGYTLTGRNRTYFRARKSDFPAWNLSLARDDWRRRREPPQVPVAAVALVDQDGRVLVAQRPPGKPLAGLWEFPGGKIEPGETPEAALIRELKEELGIDVSESCLAPFTFASHAYEDFHLLMFLYLCRVWDGIPEARHASALKWARPTAMRDLAMPPADRPLVAMLRDFV